MPSQSNSDAEQGIHRIREEVDFVHGDVEVSAHDINAQLCDVDSPKALAKKSYDPATKSVKHWLKRSSTGLDAGSLYNPQSNVFNEFAARRFHSELGRDKYEFKPVTAAAYELYLQFLRTKNPIHLRHAERAL